MYPAEIIDHYNHPHHEGELDNPTHHGKAENLNCGDSSEFFLRIENNEVLEVSHQSEGCAICVAAASLLSDEVGGKSPEEISQISKEQMLHLIATPIKDSRLGCVLLPLQAMKQALAT